MKIPQTTNVGAYYANEENGQWQPNGVIIDSGVGGGVVGSGDAGVHRPPVYPVHIPRGHIPAGYVMAGAFYPPAGAYPVPAPPQDDFEDYMWMENEEEFDKQVMQQLEEEALMEQCIEAMLEDEQRERNRPNANGHPQYPTTSNGTGLSLEETVSRSTLNPLAAEFVPTARLQPPPVQERTETTDPPLVEPTKSPDEPQTQASAESKDNVDAPEDKAEVIEPSTQETPEVSANVHIEKDKRPKEKDAKKDTKPKVDVKKAAVKQQDGKTKVTKPQSVKSEPRVTQKKKEPAKIVKSEVKVEEKEEVAPTEAPKPQQTPTEEVATPGFKPINYAAAARATKPKKPSSPPVEVPLTTIKPEKERKPEKKTEKTAPKPEKVTQRKNSAK
ncbi:unnamed protein product [Chilo suppressalis]|uniref:Ataxin-2 C-terminal domain-containing protein n=1 Tax=Chilo suppressalis TaxID=168631 RepID=A0ABN8B6Z8_CHISP|nr:hypothetical protein evm_008955 [Chilo suppressalis]CAH0404157.1 unnamed protein product [Chilo suppressalis]